MARTIITILLVLFPAVGVLAAPSGIDVVVETIDARMVTGQLVSLDSGKLVMIVDGRQVALARDELVEIVLAGHSDILSAVGKSVIATDDGYYMIAEDLHLADEQLSFTSPLLGKSSIRLGRLRGIFRPGLTQSPGELMRRCREMKLRAEAADVLLVEQTDEKDKDKSKTRLVAVSGAMRGIVSSGEDAKVAFNWQGTNRTLALKSVRAILLAPAASGKKPSRRVVGAVTGLKGSTIALSKLTYAKGMFTATGPAGVARTIKASAVAAVHFVSDRAVDLSSLKPSSVREYGFFDSKFSYRTDLSVAGGPIRLGGKVYRTGLGLHSFCELKYRLDGKYAKFVTVAGIDDAVRPAGVAALTILADGKVLFAMIELTGKDKPRILRLDISGAKELTIRVDFGSDRLDISDHIDLAAARLIKAAK